jgi:hypothetical protein
MPAATRLVVTGVCRIAADKPECELLEAAVKEYKRPVSDPLWLRPLLTRGWLGWYR